MNKRICLILALAIFVASIGTLSALAEGDSPMPSVYTENQTVTAGNTFEMIVCASDLNAVGAIDLYAFYDPEIFTVVSASSLSLASNAQTTINTDVAGEASFSMISATGVNGSGELWRIYFRVNANAAVKKPTVLPVMFNSFINVGKTGITNPIPKKAINKFISKMLSVIF